MSSGRKPLSYIVSRYDRVAPLYSTLEPLFLITPRARRKAVAALRLEPGDVVLELGAGTGRNLPYLTNAVGATGRVIAVDASAGMLAQAQALVSQHAWSNVQLIRQDAAQLTIDDRVDTVLFSLSYSVIPDPGAALARTWELLRPGGRVVVMDVGLTHSRLGPVLRPVVKLLVRLGPGDPFSRPWDELSAYGSVSIERFMLGLYYVCVLEKPGVP